MRALVLAVVFLIRPPFAAGNSDATCSDPQRISDDEAQNIAIQEMKKRSATFTPSAVIFSVKEQACELVVIMERRDKSSRRLGPTSTLVLTRSGDVKMYLGGM